ncbi:TetR/AcrR family transcriptional regulator [Denitrificimonas caeni]|uniref:TetR/AcrR family transcriptional regulator n=1 Tax=Denitrificimonas caeni TaxID=521720 RepID=UPI0019628DF0|nr:TetR/AcrR family transcriptional regulator [Denitrificimonas caeni]
MPSQIPKAGPGRPKNLSKRAAILDAAQVLFLRQGYEGSSMDAIAQEANVSKLTVYNHFTDKETLFCAAIEAKCETQLSQLFVSSTDTPPDNLRECLLAIAHSFQTLVDSPESLAMHRLIISHALSNPALSHLFYEATALRIINKMEQLLNTINNAKQLEITHTKQAAEHFFSLLKGTRNLQLLVGYQPESINANVHQHVEDVVDLFIKAYQAH